jgi:Intron-binding protein aquarius N-terminus
LAPWQKKLPKVFPLEINIPAMGLQLRPASAMDAPLDDVWTTLAQRLWLSDSPLRKVLPETVKTEVWDALEGDRFSPRALITLENLQILEKYGTTLPTAEVMETNSYQISVAKLHIGCFEPTRSLNCPVRWRQAKQPSANMEYVSPMSPTALG